MANDPGKDLQRYIDNTLEIRTLSTPPVADMKGAEEYRLTLRKNFRRIGDLAQDNNAILRACFFPLIEKKEPLTEEEIRRLRDFRASQLNAYSMDNLDLPLMYLLSERLLRDAKEKGNVHDTIRALDEMIEASFSIMHMTQRVNGVAPIGYAYRDSGLKAAYELLTWLSHERFLSLSDEDREIVLVNARYISALFDRSDAYGDAKTNAEDLKLLLNALALAEDPFFREACPNYNWTYHTFRTLQYIVQLLYDGNIRGYTPEECRVIFEQSQRLKKLWQQEESIQRYSTDALIDLGRARASYFCGETDAATYHTALMELYGHCADGDFSFFNGSLLMLVPMELFGLAKKYGVPPEDMEKLKGYYERVISHVHRMPKKGSLSFILTYLSSVLESFVEVPGGMDLETFCLRLTAALHPPTYVHVKSVAAFTVCLTRHLLKREPARFLNVCGCRTKEEVALRANEIEDFALHAALCHDIGKLFVTEVIMTYGRTLLDEEFELIKTHPGTGANMLSAHEETARYADVALMHHKWFDGKGGYPAQSFDGMTDQTMISLVTVADCLDASTDTVGRSYKHGKTLDEYVAELREGSGTRYAPYVVALFEEEEVRRDISKILTEGRDENYREAYRILKRGSVRS